MNSNDPKSLLIVDDDEEFLLYLRTTLKHSGCEIVSASSGRQAREKIAGRRFSMVVSDLRLPDLSGLEVLEEARRKDPLTVGMVLTAHGTVDSAMEALRLGAYDYLLKPCAPDILLAAIRRGMEHYELKKALIQKTSELEVLERRLSDKSRFIQNVSHELKNPLTVLYGYSSLLLKYHHETPPEDLRRNLQSIHKNAERLGSLLEDLLESARLSGNKIALSRGRVDASALALEAAENLKFEALKKEIEIKCDLAAGHPQIHADPKRVHQIFANLLGNAIKFTPEGGAITVSSAVEDGFVRFCVEDTGVGISAEDLPRLFERFYQARETQGRHSGLGLGLDICKNLVELHGGRIWAMSLQGYGSKFYFTLPLSTHPAETAGANS